MAVDAADDDGIDANGFRIGAASQDLGAAAIAAVSANAATGQKRAVVLAAFDAQELGTQEPPAGETFDRHLLPGSAVFREVALAMASSQEMRSNSPAPFGPTRFIG